MENKWYKEMFELIDSIAIALVFVVLIFTLLFRVFVVKGSSMYDTLKENDRIIVSNLFYTPKSGDIVVFYSPSHQEKILIKRVIATEGQTVDIANNRVIVDGKILDEPYIDNNVTFKRDFELPYTVEKNKIFALGDNREVSADSRYADIGAVDTKYIFGRLIIRLFPNFGKVD